MQQVYVPSLEVVERHVGKGKKSLADMFHQDGEIRHRKCKLLYKITLGMHSTHPQINDIQHCEGSFFLNGLYVV